MSILDTSVGNLRLRNPLVLASGILGSEGSLLARAAEEGFGALTTKSFTLEPREGYKTPITVFTVAGLVNAVGLANPGYKILPDILTVAKKGGVPVIVSVAASNPDEFLIISSYAEECGADAVELNLSCPHVNGHGLEIGQDPGYTGEIVKTVSGSVDIPVFIKVGLSDRVLETVSSALDSGADAVVAINTVRAMVIDVYARQPILSNKYGGLSGPAIHPIATRVIYDIYREFSPPIIGVGGVSSWMDAVEFLLAGASAVGIGTAVAFKGLSIAREILDGIEEYLVSEGFSSIEDIVGYIHKT